MQTTPIAGIPYADLTDLPNAQVATKGIAEAVDSLLIPRYLSATARNAAIVTPTAGQMCYLIAEGRFETYNGSAWRPQLRSEIGSNLISFSNVTSHTYPVTFTTPFLTTPTVNVNITSGDGSAARWCSRAYGVGLTGFQSMLFASTALNSTWVSVNVSWVATGY